MKLYITWRIIATVIFMSLLLLSCQQEGQNKSIGFVFDTTEGCEFSSQFPKVAMERLLLNKETNWEIYYTEATSVALNPIYKETIAGRSTLENEHAFTEARSIQIDSLWEAMMRSLDCSPKSATYLYVSIQRLVQEVQAGDGSSQDLYIFTDGMEHSKISFFQSKQFIHDPETVADHLEAAFGPLPDLSGIHITMIYQPKENGIALSGLEFFQWYFESKGATVILKAAL